MIAFTAMRSKLPARAQRPSRLLGLLAVLVALVSHLALGAVVLPNAAPQAELAALDAASVFCQGAHHGGDGGTPAPHRTADCALCLLKAPLTQAAVLMAAGAALPEPGHGLALRPGFRPQPRAPPAPAVAAAYPRGPPALA